MRKRQPQKTDRQKELLETALWWQELKARSNETFLPLYFDKHRHLVVKGGGGSGKSIWAGDKILNRVTSEAGHRWLVVRKVSKTLRESCFHQLRTQALDHYGKYVDRIPKGKSGDMYITFKNGSEIIFAGLDDVEKLKSIHNITGIWIEEATEILENDFDQLDIRLRGETKYFKQIILTFNPISANHWIKKRFFDRQDDRVRIHESTYKDNRFLPEEDRRTLEAYKETNPYYYTVYALGMWGVIGKTFFDAQNVQRQLEKEIKPLQKGEFEFGYDGMQIRDIRLADNTAPKDGELWLPVINAPVLIYKEPEPGRPYVIGADTAGEGSDRFVGQVLDNITGEQVAVLLCSYADGYDEDLFTRQLYCLGRYYNDALIAVETNFSTHPQKELQRLDYPKLFVRRKEDTFTGQIINSYGFQTTRLTRPVLLGELQGIMREQPELINDKRTLEEMLTFVLREDKNLRPEAEPGAHDDMVMALGIAYYARPQQRFVVEEDKKRSKWTEGMWEDYRNASREEKKMLLQLWGHPNGG